MFCGWFKVTKPVKRLGSLVKTVLSHTLWLSGHPVLVAFLHDLKSLPSINCKTEIIEIPYMLPHTTGWCCLFNLTLITAFVWRIASAYLLFLHIFHVSRKTAEDLLSHQSQWNHLILIVPIFLGGKKRYISIYRFQSRCSPCYRQFCFSQKCCKPFELDNLPQFPQAPLFFLLDSTLSTHLSHYCIWLDTADFI